MVTRYLIVLSTLLACAVAQASDEPTQRSLRPRAPKKTSAPGFSVPSAYTNPFNRMAGKIALRTLKTGHIQAGPQLANDTVDNTIFEPMAYVPYTPTASITDEISEEHSIEEMVEDFDIALPTINLVNPALPSLNMVTEDDIISMRMKNLLTVSSGRVIKPGRKKSALSRSLPELEAKSSTSLRSSLPTLRERGIKKSGLRTNNITEELNRECSQFNAAVEAHLELKQLLDDDAKKWYAITKNLNKGISQQDLTRIEAAKFDIKKWIRDNNRY